jgi:hypothetical protein
MEQFVPPDGYGSLYRNFPHTWILERVDTSRLLSSFWLFGLLTFRLSISCSTFLVDTARAWLEGHMECEQWVQIPGSVPSTVPTQTGLWQWVLPHDKPGPSEMGWFYHQKPGISSLQFSIQFSNWVLIVSRHDHYLVCAALAALSPHAVRFGIGPIFVESLSKTRQIRGKSRVILQRLNEYWSKCKSYTGRWMSG